MAFYIKAEPLNAEVKGQLINTDLSPRIYVSATNTIRRECPEKYENFDSRCVLIEMNPGKEGTYLYRDGSESECKKILDKLEKKMARSRLTHNIILLISPTLAATIGGLIGLFTSAAASILKNIIIN